MRFAGNSLGRIAVVAALTSATAVGFGAGTANAVACSSPVRYAASSNTIYLVAARAYTPADIKAACPAAPLTEVDPASHTWQLDADLVLQNGSTLVLHGPAASVAGTVGTLRLRSLASNRPTEVSQIMAKHGTIDIDSTHITSWDDAAGGPDTDPDLPSGAAGTDRGRAFIRAISYLDGATPRLSRMTIHNSEIDHLGYYGAEAYGISYKARGCDREQLAVCAKLYVSGSQTRSRFHHNFMGTYLWGAKDMLFAGNEYDNNISYGLDPHDVSRGLKIDGNRFHHNGNHGVICSQLCDRLTITNNTSHHNGLQPWRGPYGDSDTPGQVHGIMLHRGITNTTIAGNTVHDHPNGAGIAIFDSAGNTVTKNTIARTRYGIRLSVGAAKNVVSHNTLTDIDKYAVFLFQGKDKAVYTTPSGRPTGNVFDANTVTGTGAEAVKVKDSDDNRFSNSTFAKIGGPLFFHASTGTVLSNLTLPASSAIRVTGTSSQRATLTVADPRGAFGLSLDGYSSCSVTSRAGALFAAGSGTAPTTVTSSGSSLRLTSTGLGTEGAGTITPKGVTVVPATGTTSAYAAGTGAATDVSVTGQRVDTSLTVSVAGLSAGATYTLHRDGAALRRVTADRTGRVTFTDAPPTAKTHHYTLA